MLGLAARVKLQAFDRDFIDSQFLLNVGSGNEELLRKGMRRANSALGQVPLLDLVAGTPEHPGRAPQAGIGSRGGWVSRLVPEEARGVRRKAVELLVLEARAGVILASRDGSDEERRKALRRAVSRLDVAEQIDAPLPSVLFGDRADYLAELGDPGRAARDRERAAHWLLPPARI